MPSFIVMPKGDPNENEIRTAQAQVESIPGAKIIHDYFLTKGFAYSIPENQVNQVNVLDNSDKWHVEEDQEVHTQ